MGWAFVKRRMQAELGPEWQTKFESFEHHPAAAASLGQVHRARSHDGADSGLQAAVCRHAVRGRSRSAAARHAVYSASPPRISAAAARSGPHILAGTWKMQPFQRMNSGDARTRFRRPRQSHLVIRKGAGRGGCDDSSRGRDLAEGEFRPIQRIYAPNQKIAAAPELAEEIVGIFRNLARDKQARSVAWCVASLVVPPGATDRRRWCCLRIGGQQVSKLIIPYRGAPGPTTTFAPPYLLGHRPKVFVAA